MRIGIRAHDVKADTFEGLVKEIHNEGMQGLRHVGAAVVHHNGLARACFRNTKIGGDAHERCG